MCSVGVVKRELVGGNDDLADWVRNVAPADAFCSTNDADAVAWYGRIMNWVQNEPRFLQEARDEFAQSADPWLSPTPVLTGWRWSRKRLPTHVPQEGQDPGCLSPVRCDVGEHIRDA